MYGTHIKSIESGGISRKDKNGGSSSKKTLDNYAKIGYTGVVGAPVMTAWVSPVALLSGFPARQNVIACTHYNRRERMKIYERSGNFYENKGRLWKSWPTKPECL
jgi:hypothetical protein